MLPTIHLHQCLAFFLLFVMCGAASVTGRKGGSVVLMCSLSNREDLTTRLTFESKTAHGLNQDFQFWGRMQKSGSCDFYLHDLKTTDAGRYSLEVFANGKLLDRFFHDIHVKVNLTGQKDEELEFDDLPYTAESVEHETKAGWKEVWSKKHGVLTDRLTAKNGRLTIVHFTSGDKGTYRVLTSGDILVTVTVTESSRSSKDKLNSTHQDEIHDTERVPAWVWTGIVVTVMWWLCSLSS